MDNQNSRKSRRKGYNYLDKKGTRSTRHDFIETEYSKGVKNEAGEVVIRPLTPDEKAWLSQFISETEHGNINSGEEIKLLLRQRSALISDRVSAKRTGNVDEMVRIEGLIGLKTGEIEKVRERSNNFYTTEEEAQQIYEKDNARRRDVYNTAKVSDNLVMLDLDEYDRFSTEAVDSIYIIDKKKKK